MASKRKFVYRVWSNYDANEEFEVEGSSPHDAALSALYELGWLISASPVRKPRKKAAKKKESKNGS